MNTNIISLILQHLPPQRKSGPHGTIYICCPMCMSMGETRNDTKFRGGFTQQVSSFIYHCYNCKFATRYSEGERVGKNLMKFITALGIPSKKIPIALRLLPPGKTINKTIKIDVPDVAIDFDEMSLPKGCRQFEYWADMDEPPQLFLEAIEYLYSRGHAVFDGWKYFWTDDKSYKNNQRIIIPFYHNGKIVGYSGRKFTNTEMSRYWQKKPDEYMFNQDKLESDNKTILLVEGVLDAIAIKGVAVLGNHISEKQMNLLKASQKRIILIPDRNKAGYTLVEQFMKENWEISIPDWDAGINDVADATKKYGRLYTLETILDSATTNKITTKIRFELVKSK